jgi:hypothetical protein
MCSPALFPPFAHVRTAHALRLMTEFCQELFGHLVRLLITSLNDFKSLPSIYVDGPRKDMST